ncbi:MAG TPA: hypothetical protein PLM14_14510 [Candidatus Hydrogenedentes bacterium]|nr:hypothetical protein [Candidatus Hydrogenedentota bacterium]HQE84211.1 hypothetical protein [Candidatus Hydrogenedentota bacterium]HQH53886.1 hypothetical protein [Candidatus Hydrogenedentota bacterium]HQM48957.1 hypothetical protein [Candidatus Hydrogenedentota bacterium]
MADLLTIVIPVGLVALLLTGALRYLLHSWVDYQVRIAVLKELDRHPGLLTEPGGAGSDALPVPAPSSHGRVDYMVTGITLGVIGICCVAAGWSMRVGQLAVGIYLGGIFCLCIGFLLGLAGLVVRRMRTPQMTGE